MHAGEADIHATLVARLVAAQFPRWAKTCAPPAACRSYPHRERDACRRLRMALVYIPMARRRDGDHRPPPDEHKSFRGVPLSRRDSSTRDAIRRLRNTFDAAAVIAAWEAALHAPVWQGGDVWLHGDLHAANLLARHGRLSAVIDFGFMGVGDPACDVMAAWTYLSAETRDTFRSAPPLDDATWACGRGWALSFGLIALPYYDTTNPELAGIARRSIEEVLADERRYRSSGGC